MALNISNFAEDINLQIQEAEQSQIGETQRKSCQNTAIIKLLKTEHKGKILESSEREMTPYL